MYKKAIAIIAAAGLAQRMKSKTNKAFLHVSGKSIICRTVKTFLKTDLFQELIIMVHPLEDSLMRQELAEFRDSSARISIVVGGETRQQSIRLGLEFWQKDNPEANQEEWICLVHDGARCLVSESVIQACYGQILTCHGAVGVAIPVTDTVHLVDSQRRVEKTLKRERLYAAQTPQGAHLDQLIKAYDKAKSEGFEATDDISVLRNAGYEVRICLGENDNIKITHPEDLGIAENLLQNRGE